MSKNVVIDLIKPKIRTGNLITVYPRSYPLVYPRVLLLSSLYCNFPLWYLKTESILEAEYVQEAFLSKCFIAIIKNNIGDEM